MNLTLSPRRRRRLALAAASVAGFYLMAWLALPWALKPWVESQASQALGRQVTLQGLSFHPWSLELTAEGLQVAKAGGNGPQLTVDRMLIDAELASMWRLAPVVKALEVERPVLQLTHDATGQLDVQDILDRLNPPDAVPPPDTGPPRLAIYNIAVRHASVTLTDAPRELTHHIDDLALTIPFVVTLGSAQEVRDVRVQPHLSFTLNGSHFETATDSQPFGDSLATQATLTLRGLDLAPYLPYWPRNLPVRPRSAVLAADLAMGFHQLPTPTVTLTGTLGAEGVALDDGVGQPLLSLGQIQATLADVRPLQQVAQLSELTLTEPEIHLSRDAQGRLNLPPASSQTAKSKPNSIATKSISKSDLVQEQSNKSSLQPPPAPGPATPETPGNGWQLGIERLQLTRGRVNWRDAATPVGGLAGGGATRLSVQALELTAQRLNWPLASDPTQAANVQGSAELGQVVGAKGTAPVPPARLTVSGRADAQGAVAQLGVEAFALPLVTPYLRAHLNPALTGQFDADARLNWSASQGMTLDIARAALSRVQVRPEQGEPASLALLEVRGARIDPQSRHAELGQVSLTRPSVALHRLANGHWMFEDWLRNSGQTAAKDSTNTPPAERRASTPSPAAPWTWRLGELAVNDGQLGWRDDSAPSPVALNAAAVQLKLQSLASRGLQPAPLSASLRIAAGHTEPGTLSWKGTLALGDDGQTPQAKGQLVATRLPAHALAPYAADQLNLSLLRADSSFNGQIAFAASAQGPRVQLNGDVTLEDFRANTLPSGGTGGTAEEWLHWKTLNLKGVGVQLAPAKAPQIDIASGALSDFFARVVIQENGRINLQDVRKPSATSPSGTPAVAASAGGSSPASSPSAAPPPSAAAAVPANAAADALAPVIRIGPFSLVNGSVNFSDHFIRPNYQADLSDLTGRLGGFSSVVRPSPDGTPAAPDMAELELRGRAEGTASLDITGRVNPLAQPLALDIQGKVRDLELPPLSPYTIKYTGHGIERGKLSLDVAYTVLPDGKLTARNQLVLNQLTFGDAVPGAPASLPVKLAVALLADRQGVIDLDLPIQGSLNDPQFSLVPVVFKIIGNVIVKAVTAPFSLLARALGGGADDMGSVAFLPGSTRMQPASITTLEKLAKALMDRPALNLTVVGQANLEAERTAYQREQLRLQVLAERQRGLKAAPSEGTAPTPGIPAPAAEAPRGEPAELTPEEATRWLTAVYKRSDMPKPRNALGLAKDLAPQDMEALLLAQIPVTNSAIHALAVQRAVVVRDALLRLNVPAQRLFQGTPVTQPAASDAAWQPVATLTPTVP